MGILIPEKIVFILKYRYIPKSIVIAIYNDNALESYNCRKISILKGQFWYQALSEMHSYQHRVWDPHYKDKTVVRPFHIYNGNGYTGKTRFFTEPRSDEQQGASDYVL